VRTAAPSIWYLRFDRRTRCANAKLSDASTFFAADKAAEPHYLGHRVRLRARLRAAGIDALNDYEILEVLLFALIPRQDTKPIAKAFARGIRRQFRSALRRLARAPEEGSRRRRRRCDHLMLIRGIVARAAKQKDGAA